MTNKEIYTNKIYSQLAGYLKVKKTKDYADAYLEINEFFKNINRTDLETVKSVMPLEFIENQNLEEDKIKELITTILNKSQEYHEFYKTYSSNLKESLDVELEKRGFKVQYKGVEIDKDYYIDCILNAEYSEKVKG